MIAGPEAAAHDHHHDTDPHTWLDPVQAMAMADTISHRLQALLPAESEAIQARSRELKKRLAQIDQQACEILAPYQGRVFIVFHPAFGHFAAAYGLVQVSVEAGGHEPGPRHLAEVIDKARACGAESVVVQPQFSRKSAETVADAIGATVLVLDPLAADYESNLVFLAQSLADSFALEDGS
jgi:zinc transport system substrate-binding protein